MLLQCSAKPSQSAQLAYKVLEIIDVILKAAAFWKEKTGVEILTRRYV